MINKEVEDEHNKMKDEMAKDYGGHLIKEAEYRVKAIGYLCIREKYDVGEVPEGFVEKLKQVYHSGVMMGSLGFHECEFCLNQGVKELSKDALSSEEKTVRDEKNKIDYMFPKMIFHYIKIHQYYPPKEFIRLIMEL